MTEIKQTETFLKWVRKLRSSQAKAIIASRLFRLSNGLGGDISPVGEGISELRIHYGAGYRIYFKQVGERLIILLCAGDKSTQKKDILLARKLARQLGN